MTAPQLSKAWTVTPNLRRAYTSLVDQVGHFAYQQKVALLAAGWSLIWSSDGTTGPINPGDTTDRIASASSGFVTRAANTTTAQSWFLVENWPDGVQILFSYTGASDDIMRVAFSPGNLYTLAGTTTFCPTATDEVVVTAATSVVGATTSLDRVFSIWTADDQSAWRCAIWRNNTLLLSLTVEKTYRIAPAATYPLPYVGSKFTTLARDLTATTSGLSPIHFAGGLSALGASSSRGFYGSIFTAATTRVCRMFGIAALGNDASAGYGSTSMIASAAVLANTYCASLGGNGALCWPITLWGEKTSNFDGPWCTLVDWHQVMTASLTNPGVGDFIPGFDFGDNVVSDPVRTNWFVSLGSAALWPWKNAAVSLETI